MNDEPNVSPGGNEHDAWLREALRHAPDADAAPPRGISDAILREARSATAMVGAAAVAATASPAAQSTPPSAPQRAARPSPWWQGIADFWASLGRGRMATSFAGVLAAVLVGLMWWEQPMDDALPRPPAPSSPPVAAAPIQSAPTAPAAVISMSPTSPMPVPPPVAARDQQAAPPADASARLQRQTKVGDGLAADAPRSLAKDAGKMRDEEAAPSAFPAGGKAKAQLREESVPRVLQSKDEDASAGPRRRGAARPAAPAQTTEAMTRGIDAETATTDALRQRDKADRPEPSPAAPVLAPAPTPAPATTALAKAAAPAPAPAVTDRKQAGAEAAPEARNSMRVAPTSVTSAAGPPASMLAGNASRARADTATPAQPLRSLLERLSAEAPAWRRQAAGGSATGLDADVREWLASIDAAAKGWALVEPALADQRAAIGRLEESGRSELRLLHDGQLAAVVRVEAGAVVVETQGEGPPRTWRAALPAERASRLKASLPAPPR